MVVARCETDEEAAANEVIEGADLGIVGDDTQVFGDGTFSPAPGVNTVCVFPKNAGKCKWMINILLFKHTVCFCPYS